MLYGLLVDYNYWAHVPNDMSVDRCYLPPHNFKMQTYLNNIQIWSDKNEVKINEHKGRIQKKN